MRPRSLAARLFTAEGLLAVGCLATLMGLKASLAARDRALVDVRMLSGYSRTVHWAGLSCRRYLDAVVGSRDAKRMLPTLREAMNGLRRSGTLAGNIGLTDEASELAGMRRFVSASESLLRRASALQSSGRRREADELFRSGLKPLAEEFLGKTLEERLQADEARRARSLADLESWIRGSFLLAAAALAAGFALLMLWTHRLAAYLTGNLERIRRSMSAIASGNFAGLEGPGHDDEVGRLTRSLNEMAERLAKTQQRIVSIERQAAFGQLATGAAHALNNPLAAVIGYTELLLRRDPDAHDREDLEIVRDQARRCEAILRNLRQFSSRGELEKKPVDVNELLTKLLEFLQPTLESAGIAVEHRFESGLPFVQGNAAGLQQVFYNLLMNASQALKDRESPRVVLLTWSQAGQTAISVADNGEGIAEEHMPRVFEPFFTTRAPAEGVGLGLSSAFGIVQDHQGTIQIRSDRSGGTRALVLLPALGAPGVRETVARRGGLKGKVVVVDDEPEILALVARVLRREGLEVTPAPGAVEAVDAVRHASFDLILSDYRMPGMDGLQLYGELCRIRPAAGTRFIFSTGEIVSRDFKAFADTHGLPVLLKPFDLDELVSVVRARLEVIRSASADA